MFTHLAAFMKEHSETGQGVGNSVPINCTANIGKAVTFAEALRGDRGNGRVGARLQVNFCHGSCNMGYGMCRHFEH